MLLGQLDKTLVKRDKLFDLFQGNHINKPEFLDRKKLVDIEQETLNKQLDELKSKLGCVDSESFDLDSTIGFCTDMKEVFDELEIDDRKELVRNLLTEIQVDDHHIDYSIQILPKVLSPVQCFA